MWKAIGRARIFWKKCKEDNVSAFASQAAFFIVMSLIPFIMLFYTLVAAVFLPVIYQCFRRYGMKRSAPVLHPKQDRKGNLLMKGNRMKI